MDLITGNFDTYFPFKDGTSGLNGGCSVVEDHELLNTAYITSDT